MGLDDAPLDPNATDQLAAALGPSSGGDLSFWAPDHWFASDQPAGVPANLPSAQPAQVAPSAPVDATPPIPVDAGAPQQPPPIDTSLIGAPPPIPPPGADQAPPPQVAPVGTPDLQPQPTVASSGLVNVSQEPANMPAVDALTGAGGPPAVPAPVGDATLAKTPDQQYQSVAGVYRQRPDVLVDRLVNGGPMDDSTQRYLNEMAQRDPAGFAELGQHIADARTKKIAAETARIHDEDYKRQQENIQIRNKAIEDARARTAELDARAEDLAKTKIGQMSIGQRIGGLVAATIGGFVQGKWGGRNAGADAFNESINREIENQKADLANKRGLLGEQRTAVSNQIAQANDLYNSDDLLRLAALKHADEQLATQQQNFAADGTRGMQIAATRAGVQANIAKARQDYEQKTFDNSVKLQTAAREQQLADSTVAKNRADIAKTYADISKIKSEIGGDQPLTPQQIHERFPQLPVAAIPPGGMKMKDLEKHVELYNKATEAGNKESSTLIRDPVTFEPLMTKEGTPARAGDATIAEKVNERSAQSQRFVDTLSSIKRTLATDPSSFDRAKFAALGTEFNAAKKDFIKSTGANFTSREMQAVEDMFGPELDNITTRAAGRSKAIERFNKLIDMAKGDTDSELGTKFGVARKKNPDGSYQSIIRDTSNPPPTAATPDDTQVKMALGKAGDVSPPVSLSGPLPSQALGSAMDRISMARHGKPFGALTAADLRNGEGERIRQEAQRTVGLDLQHGQLDAWAAQLRSPDPAVAAQAAQHLGDVAGAGQSPGGAEGSIRERARQILQNNIGAGLADIPSEAPP